MCISTKLDLKQSLAMLANLLRFKHQPQSGRRELSKVMKEMDAGKKTELSDLSTNPGHG